MANLVLASLVADSVGLAHASAVLRALDLVAPDLAGFLPLLSALLRLRRERDDDRNDDSLDWLL